MCRPDGPLSGCGAIACDSAVVCVFCVCLETEAACCDLIKQRSLLLTCLRSGVRRATIHGDMFVTSLLQICRMSKSEHVSAGD